MEYAEVQVPKKASKTPTIFDLQKLFEKTKLDSYVNNGTLYVIDHSGKYTLKQIVSFLINNIKYPGVEKAEDQDLLHYVKIDLGNSGYSFGVGIASSLKKDGIKQNMFSIIKIED